MSQLNNTSKLELGHYRIDSPKIETSIIEKQSNRIPF